MGVGTAPSRVSPGMAVGHNIHPRRPEPAAVIPTWVCPSSGAKACNGRGILSLSLWHSPAILLCTFSSRQQDPAFQCHGIPLKMRVRVQLCRSSQEQLIQTLQKLSPFNYFGRMGENNIYWSYGHSSLPPTSPAVYRGEWVHEDVAAGEWFDSDLVVCFAQVVGFGTWSMTLIQGIYIPFLSQEPGWGRG